MMGLEYLILQFLYDFNSIKGYSISILTLTNLIYHILENLKKLLFIYYGMS